MSDFIGHECGLAIVRLRQPLDYYRQRYGDAAWGLRRLYLLMEKQHNRGQDGAGVAVVKFDMPPGERFMRRVRSSKHNAIERVFDVVMKDVRNLSLKKASGLDDLHLKLGCEFLGEAYLGHLRYATHSGNSVSQCHPYTRNNNVASRNIAIAGNFNMTNSIELFHQLVEYGLNPVGDSDTRVVLEQIGYALDCEHDQLHASMGPNSFRGLVGRDLAVEISADLDIARIMAKASEQWDGGYTFGGLLGNGDAFACRDPAGIRPGFWYANDEVFAVASERAALANVFDVEPDDIEPIKPGHVVYMKHNGRLGQEQFKRPQPLRQCTFERVYFSRGNDPDIYAQRKALGRQLAQRVLTAIDGDTEHAVFSYIPNTAETAFVGLVEEIDRLSRADHADQLWKLIESQNVKRSDLDQYLNGRLRAEKVAHKDQRLRTFITHDQARRDLVSHIYDITRDVVHDDDTLIVLDDSIVRGTTLRDSIITMLSRLNPKRIVIVSSAPPILYPDCYGIDMSQLGRFVGFEAAVRLLEDHDEQELVEEIEHKCREQQDKSAERMVNHVKLLYDRFTLDELSAKIAQLVRSDTLTWNGELQVIYQTIDGLHASMPGYTGDWYFTGDYPTPGGYKVLNTSFLKWRSLDDARAY